MSKSKQCKCSHCELVAATEVVGCDEAIKQEFAYIMRKQNSKTVSTRTADDIVKQTNILARRLAAMNGIHIKTPYHNFSKCESGLDKHYWSMACMAQELLTGTIVFSFDASLARIINNNIRLIKAYEKFEQIAEALDVSIEDIINAQAKAPSATTDRA